MPTIAKATQGKQVAPPPGDDALSRSLPIDARYYPADVSVDSTIPQRCAQYLDNCAKKWPYQLIRYDEVYRNIHLLKKRGNTTLQDIKRTKQQVRSCQKWLAEYGRHLVLGEMGARAAVDDLDIVTNVAPKKMSRVVASIKAAQQMDALVNTKNLPKGNPMADWYRGDFRPVLGQLTKAREELMSAVPEPRLLPEKTE
jgi:hypothetical protein